jgi:hypothetical protein
MTTQMELARRLSQAMSETGTTHTDLAAACGVRVPSVYGWLKTGRIAKRHLLTFVDFFGRPLSWWLGKDTDDEEMLTRKERDAILALRKLPPELQQRVFDEIEFLKRLPPPPPSKPPVR